MLCLEYFGYHSRSFDRTIPRVPTQKYSFELLRQAIRRDATIIVMRSRDLWFAAVPELIDANAFTLNSWQSVYITEANCPKGYADIVRRLSS
uniref:Uncharacterized protein n=1 Tax=mine drainage metagenome TaxID=410659 RepID=E6PIT0_9ZZZZ